MASVNTADTRTALEVRIMITNPSVTLYHLSTFAASMTLENPLVVWPYSILLILTTYPFFIPLYISIWGPMRYVGNKKNFRERPGPETRCRQRATQRGLWRSPCVERNKVKNNSLNKVGEKFYTPLQSSLRVAVRIAVKDSYSCRVSYKYIWNRGTSLESWKELFSPTEFSSRDLIFWTFCYRGAADRRKDDFPAETEMYGNSRAPCIIVNYCNALIIPFLNLFSCGNKLYIYIYM